MDNKHLRTWILYCPKALDHAVHRGVDLATAYFLHNVDGMIHDCTVDMETHT